MSHDVIALGPQEASPSRLADSASLPHATSERASRTTTISRSDRVGVAVILAVSLVAALSIQLTRDVRIGQPGTINGVGAPAVVAAQPADPAPEASLGLTRADLPR